MAAILSHALEDPRPEVAALACLGLGRQRRRPDGGAPLARLAGDAARPARSAGGHAWRWGARGAAGGRGALELLDGGDEDLSRAAAMALAWTRDPRALPALLARALLAGRVRARRPGGSARRAAASGWPAERHPTRPAPIAGNDLAVREVLAALDADAAAAAISTPLWRAHTRRDRRASWPTPSPAAAVRAAPPSTRSTRGPTARAGRAGAAGGRALPPEQAASAAREIAWPLADQVAAALDDPDRRTRAAALRVLAKLDDERLTPARLAEAVADGAPLLADAAVDGRPDPGSGPSGARRANRRRDRPAADRRRLVAAASWSCRLSAVELLAALGPAGLPPLDRAASDRNALVRAAALERPRPSPRGSGPRLPRG